MNMKILVAAGAILISISASAQECFPAPENMVAWWTGDTETVDLVEGLSGTLHGGSTFTVGKVLDAFSFDGSTGYMEAPHSSALSIQDEITIDAWIMKLGPCTYNCPIIVKQNATGPCCNDLRYALIVYGWGDHNVTFSFNTHTWQDNVVSQTPILDGVWYHLAGTYDGTIAKIYVNGVLDNEAQIREPGPIKPSDGGPLYLGLGRHSYDEFFNGLVDEVEIFNRALSPTEISAIYEAGIAGKCKDEDGDGYRPPLDCNDYDALIHPDAVELPGNFTDENCDGDLGDCDPCIDWRNHGDYVRCIAHAVNDLGNFITDEEGDNLVSSAAQSDIGKKGFVPTECQ